MSQRGRRRPDPEANLSPSEPISLRGADEGERRAEHVAQQALARRLVLGRKLSVTFKKTTGGTLVTFDPALDIKLAMMLNKLSESLRVDMPVWLGDEIFDVMLGGAPKPSVLIPAPTCDVYGTPISKSEVEVVTGTLSLAATSL